MPDLALFILVLIAAYLLPGPDMLLMLHSGVVAGPGRSGFTALGLALARASHVLLALTGLGLLFQTWPGSLQAVRIAGALYLGALGLSLLRAHPAPLPRSSDPTQPPSRRRLFLQGLLTNGLNPKALLFGILLLPRFVQPDGADLTTQGLILGATLVGVGVLFDGFYALAGAGLGHWLNRHPGAQRWQYRAFAALLCLCAVEMLWWPLQ